VTYGYGVFRRVGIGYPPDGGLLPDVR